MLRGGDGDSAIEQGWLLRELMQRFGLGLDELARRFDRSTSWVSRRLGLVTDLAGERCRSKCGRARSARMRR